jgi:transglutaminase-like putative cysteine protease
MDRRTVLAAMGACGALVATSAARAAAAPPAGWRRYRLAADLDLTGHPGPAKLWVPLAQQAAGYQKASAPSFRASGHAAVVHDRRYGAPMLRVAWPAGDGPRSVHIEQVVDTRDRGLIPARLSAHERAFWTAATESLPTSGLVGERARQIVGERRDPRAKARAIYDWVVDNTFRDAAVRGCGLGGVEGMLRSGYLGGKCADINSLATALCRAAGLPARDVYGVRLGPSAHQASLGIKTADATHAQHCRAEVFLDGEGWLPIDPADVRKVVLEGGVPVTSPVVQAERERLFGQWEMNWAGYNSATDIRLPGEPAKPVENFLMYPLAMTPQGELDQLAPESFRYKITATPV